MEVAIVLLVLIAILIAYFGFGMFVKFLWGWFPFLLGLLLFSCVGLSGGWWRALVGIFICFSALLFTDAWHRTSLYLRVEESIDKAFYFDD